MKKYGLILLVLAALIGWRLFALARERTAKTGGARSASAVAVAVAPAGRETIREIRVLSGSIVPRSQFTAAPKIAGRLKKLHVDIGDTVRKGDLVAILDDEEYRQTVEQSRAELEVAKANVLDSKSVLEIAAREYARTQELLKQKVASQAETEKAQAVLLAAEARQAVVHAQVRQAEAALKADEVRLDYTRILATWDDNDEVRVIGERFADEGAMLRANDPIVSILDIEPVLAILNVIERDYTLVQPGQEAVLSTDARPAERFPGRVIRKAPLLKEGSRQARVEIEVPNPDHRLAPGMFVRAELVFDTHPDAQTVPAGALLRRDEQTGLFVADAQNRRARFVPVKTGILSGSTVEILSPVISEPVIVLGQHLLQDGAPIRLPETPPGARP
ncbi:MAG: efflux RND transporter periplasmic adaptor subunit [Kiritimatiellia bacterium]